MWNVSKGKKDKRNIANLLSGEYAQLKINLVNYWKYWNTARMITYFKVSFNPFHLNTTCPALANSVDPDQLASEEANWSGSALFVIKYVNFYQKPG